MEIPKSKRIEINPIKKKLCFLINFIQLIVNPAAVMVDDS
jgi:hypothetical protein